MPVVSSRCLRSLWGAMNLSPPRRASPRTFGGIRWIMTPLLLLLLCVFCRNGKPRSGLSGGQERARDELRRGHRRPAYHVVAVHELQVKRNGVCCPINVLAPPGPPPTSSRTSCDRLRAGRHGMHSLMKPSDIVSVLPSGLLPSPLPPPPKQR